MFENPPTSALWGHVRDRFGPTGIGHGCAYGLRGRRGGLLRKAYKWATESPVLLVAVTRRCAGDHDHEPVEGLNTSASGIYPRELAWQIVLAIRELARQRSPGRFEKLAPRPPPESAVYEATLDVYYLDLSYDTGAWTTVLTELDLSFEDTRARAITIPDDHPVVDAIRQLVPWELTRLSYVRDPRSRRIPRGVPWSHRAVIRRLDDSSVRIESESRLALAYPCLRFLEPTDVAVFIYGSS